MAEATIKYDIFVSHSSKDKEKARFLAKDLESLGYKVWFDSEEIEASEDWIKEIEQGVDNSSVIVIIWTENSAGSKWVEREIARADDQKKPIIPLLFDDTKVSSILLQRVQHIDFRQGYHAPFQELVSCLIRLLEDGTQTILESTGLAWQPVKHPFYRSRFLEENHYLDRRSSTFAVNERTRLLVDYEGSNPHVFMSIVSVPIPKPINIDFEGLPEILNPYLSRGPQVQDSLPLWQRFNLSEFIAYNTTQSDYLLYKPHQQLHGGNKICPKVYIRFDEDGAIEYAICDYVVHGVNPSFYNGYAFNLILILGTGWKFINLATKIYGGVMYDGKFQMLVNLKNTQGNILDGFAMDPTGRATWPSRSSRDTLLRYRFEGTTHGIATDENLQFAYEVDTRAFSHTPSLSQDLMVHLSRSLQRGFNWNVDDRHYIPNTTEFPWRQFYQHSGIG